MVSPASKSTWSLGISNLDELLYRYAVIDNVLQSCVCERLCVRLCEEEKERERERVSERERE